MSDAVRGGGSVESQMRGERQVVAEAGSCRENACVIRDVLSEPKSQPPAACERSNRWGWADPIRRRIRAPYSWFESNITDDLLVLVEQSSHPPSDSDRWRLDKVVVFD